MLKTKYVMLYNYETKKEKKEVQAFLEKMPVAKLLPYGVLPGIEEGTIDIEKEKISLWIPEPFFLSAWTYFNHDDLKRGAVSFEDALEYFSLQSNDSRFCKEEWEEGVVLS